MWIRVLVRGVYRARIVSFVNTEPYLEVETEQLVEPPVESDAHGIALRRMVLDLFEQLANISTKVSSELLASVNSVDDAGQMADIIASSIIFKLEDKQRLLECIDINERLEMLVTILPKELEITAIENEIRGKVRKQIDKSQKEYVLREQLRAIQNELGESGSVQSDADELRERLAKLSLSDDIREKVEKEISRMEKLSLGSPELGVIRTYVEWILDLPWNVMTEDNLDLEHARAILDEDHYGLEKVKDRIIEYLAVLARKKDNARSDTVLCRGRREPVRLPSPVPSRAVGRKFVRIR